MWRMECEDTLNLMPELTNSLSLIVSGRNDEEIDRGWNNLRELEDNGLFQGPVDLCDAEAIIRAILRGSIMNLLQVPKLMGYFAKYVKKKDDDDTSDELDDSIVDDYVAFMKMTAGKDISLLTSMVETLRDHPVYRSSAGANGQVCRAIVSSLGAFPMPAHVDGSITEFKANVARIQESLRTICKSSDGSGNSDLMTTCLETVYGMISDTDRKDHPGPGLVAILELVENRMIPQAVVWIMLEAENDSQLERALEVMCNWVPQWLQVDRLVIWVMAFVGRLEATKKYDILLRVGNAAYVKKLLFCVMLPISGKQAALLATIVLRNQPTAHVFHKNVKTIEIVFAALKKQPTEAARECERTLVNVTKALIERFPGHGSYDSLENSFPVAPQMDNVEALRDEHVWSNEEDRFPCPEINVAQPNDHGKVGLTNLGNTCYMNSVLQALAMTRQFSQEVMRHKPASPNADNEGSTWVASAEEAASIMPKLQNLFALLAYSPRRSLSPTEILAASRPDYFTPGQQQDSSEFLCHLLDVLYEQEKSLSRRIAGVSEGSSGPSGKGKRSSEVMSPDRGVIKRWTTEEDLSEGISLERKTSQSLGDFPQPDDDDQLGRTQPEKSLSDCHSDSTDSGIQSVDGCAGHSDDSAGSQSILVHRVFGGESKITYQCAQCDTSSHNNDRFRDLQLCFPQEISDNQDVSVQDLMNYYLTPEKMTGENKYRCDTCTKLCDAQRIIKILRAPIHLILTLKHFHYDPETRLRTKLRHKVTYNEIIQLPVSQIGDGVAMSPIAETYSLYAAVVHSGYSMDYGHYITYARDSKQNWYKFNDSWVSRTSLEDFTALQPPDTPYILFYEKMGTRATNETTDEEMEKPELSTLSKHVRDLIDRDARDYEEEMRHQTDKKRSQRTSPGGPVVAPYLRRHDNSDDENPPPSNCRGPIDIPASRFLY